MCFRREFIKGIEMMLVHELDIFNLFVFLYLVFLSIGLDTISNFPPYGDRFIQMIYFRLLNVRLLINM